MSYKNSLWLFSWTINRQDQFKEQKKDEVCVWFYGLFTDAVGDYIRKPIKDCRSFGKFAQFYLVFDVYGFSLKINYKKIF